MYREKIAKLAPGYDPAHVEAYMRAATSLNIESISDDTFAEILRVACKLVDHHGLDDADNHARSIGLKPKRRITEEGKRCVVCGGLNCQRMDHLEGR